jgi:glycosyltransferase involved in cell wall biosynthesis
MTTKHSKHLLRSKYNIPLDKKIILFVGSLKPLKNPLNILKALQILGTDYLEQNKLVLVYAGDGILKEDITKFAKENCLLNYVYLLGNVPLESIHEIYSLVDLYVICSSFEGTPIALLEAMFNSLPILASDAPGINSILKNNVTAILYNTEDYNDLANGLRQLLADPVKENLIKTNANIYFNEHFDYHTIISEYIKIIDS